MTKDEAQELTRAANAEEPNQIILQRLIEETDDSITNQAKRGDTFAFYYKLGTIKHNGDEVSLSAKDKYSNLIMEHYNKLGFKTSTDDNFIKIEWEK